MRTPLGTRPRCIERHTPHKPDCNPQIGSLIEQKFDAGRVKFT
jgi:hypothetical protein